MSLVSLLTLHGRLLQSLAEEYFLPFLFSAPFVGNLPAALVGYQKYPLLYCACALEDLMKVNICPTWFPASLSIY